MLKHLSLATPLTLSLALLSLSTTEFVHAQVLPSGIGAAIQGGDIDL